MIKPTIGRVVWFWKDGTGLQQQPEAGIVCYVHSDALVNLVVFNSNGQPQSRTSVRLLQDGDARPAGYFAEWMPYQKGQAAKTEELEKQLKG